MPESGDPLGDPAEQKLHRALRLRLRAAASMLKMRRSRRFPAAVAGASLVCAAAVLYSALPAGSDVAGGVKQSPRWKCGPPVVAPAGPTTVAWGKLALPPFDDGGPFNNPIPATAVVSRSSGTFVSKLAELGRSRGFGVAVRAWTVPVFFATPATKSQTVPLTAHFARRPVSRPIPLPRWARPDPEGDGHLAIIDPATGCEHDFWQAARNEDGTWSASWQNSVPLAGTGVFPSPKLSARGSGFALTSGLIHPGELRAGEIKHALLFSYRYTRKGAPVWPATESDGQTSASYALPMGALLRLDPSLDLEALELTPVEQTIARALQVYGMYLGDTGGAVSLYAVHPSSYKTNPYGDLFDSGPYTLLKGIPLDRLQLIEPLSR
jgi:hypothetical protein